MATSVGGAMVEKQNQQIDFGNAVANRVEEINRQAEIEKEQYKAENRPKGEMKAWGYTMGQYINTIKAQDHPAFGIWFYISEHGTIYADEETDVDNQKFELLVKEKGTDNVVYTQMFIYGELYKNTSEYARLIIPAEYLDDDKYDYGFKVVVE